MTTADGPMGGTERLAAAQEGTTRSAGAGAAGSEWAGAAGGPAGAMGDDWGEAGDRVGDWGEAGSADTAGPLLDPDDADAFASRWDEIQAAFVDEPRQAVVDADNLVAEVIQRLTRMFADEHTRLEAGLERNDEASTEDLRVGLQRYRDFFHRLLAA